MRRWRVCWKKGDGETKKGRAMFASPQEAQEWAHEMEKRYRHLGYSHWIESAEVTYEGKDSD